MTEPTDHLTALRASVDHLTQLVVGLDDHAIERSAYPEEWTVAQVMSHVGSGAVIMRRRVDDGLTGTPVPDDFAPEVWAAWDSRSPRAQVDDGRDADRALLGRVESLTDAERAGLQVPLGPMTLDFESVVALRLNEHVLHTWDIEIALSPGAELLPVTLPLVVDNLDLIARFAAKPNGSSRTIRIRTTDPERHFLVQLGPDAVDFSRASGTEAADLELPAEAFIRLVYGRLDPAHTPGVRGRAELLDELRSVYPGV